MNRSKHALVVLLAVITAFRLWYIHQEFLDLAPDEAHYWEWSRVPALSYYSKGPMVAYIIYISTALIGNTPLGVRLGAVVLAAGTTLIIYRLAQELFVNRQIALGVALLPHLIPLFAAGALIMTIDSPFVFFWSWSLYWIYTAITRAERWRWSLMGVTFGLGILSKYTMLFFLPSVLVYLLLSPQDRQWLRRSDLYYGFGIGMLFFLPIILWNAQHDWVSLKHLFGQVEVHHGLNLHFSWQLLQTLGEFVGGQAGVISPLLFLLVLYSMGRTGYVALKHRERSALFLSAFFFPIFCTYLLLSLRQKVQANWPVAAYIPALIATAGVFSPLFRPPGVGEPYSFVLRVEKERNRRKWSIVVCIALALSGVLTGLGHFPQIPAWAGFTILPKMDPTTRLRGWKSLGAWVGQWRAEWSERPLPFVVTDSYQVASELAFYTPGQPRTYCLNLGRRQNQYDIWGGLENLKGQEAFFVHGNGPHPPPKLFALFQTCHLLSSLPIYYKEREIKRFFLFHCTHFTGVPTEVELRRY